MNYLLSAALGLAAGWVAGRLVAITANGATQDMIAGLIGGGIAGFASQTMSTIVVPDRLTTLVSAVGGGLALALMRRAYADRYLRGAH
jgi:uncharacterized membrane protein YeaQ/YmgE (transglycosylase-associated protein family)